MTDFLLIAVCGFLVLDWWEMRLMRKYMQLLAEVPYHLDPPNSAGAEQVQADEAKRRADLTMHDDPDGPEDPEDPDEDDDDMFADVPRGREGRSR